ncbi:asparagine synthase (glutamine-hydrolyzing) [Paracoccidioides brasiliensis Pb03]|nr:asparagine synthase (glutamine-hydrolyzing) [Paracoccidioides brasiliensis Pb03]
MCGITASIALPMVCLNGTPTDYVENPDDPSLVDKLRASIEKINYRGPDESGIWVNSDGSVGLGHCRLSINDLSPSGSQPLSSDDGQIHAVVNGELYDYDRLRVLCSVVHGYEFHGESDSELVLALYKIYGAPKFLKHLRGEFAFVLYDGREGHNKVIAVRDRFGIKPLFWTIVGNRILLAAEAKAFLPLGWKPEWDIGSIIECGWMADDRTLFKGVSKLRPGHLMEISEKGIEIQKYWDAEYADKTKVDPRTIDEMIIGVRERLVESIRLRLRADVPVGVYLSGGIDSSAVAGIVTQLARKYHVKIGNQKATRVACFSVQFPEKSGFNESNIADRTAKWLGVEAIKMDVDEATLAKHFADASYHCEHDNHDLNYVAKFALSTLPQENGVKVVLTGEGSDEIFAGYPYFPQDYLLEPDLSQPDSPLVPSSELREDLQKDAVAGLRNLFRIVGAGQYGSDEDEQFLADANGTTISNALKFSQPPAEIFASWMHETNMVFDSRAALMASQSPEVLAKIRSSWHPLHTSLYLWSKSSLPNVLLSSLGDRTEMAHSVEGRTPFLDHHLVEYVNGLPPSVKIAYAPEAMNGQDQGPLWKLAGRALQAMTEKWILREAVRPYITDELYQRKKFPFLAPSRWPEQGPLHLMFEKLLTREAVESLGFVDYDVVREMLGRAFGANEDSKAFRTVLCVGSWVILGQRLGVKKAEKADYIR